MASLLAALAYAALATACLWRLRPTDSEAWYTGAGLARERATWVAQFGTAPPTGRLPFRMPVEYALWAWAPSLPAARVLGVALGMATVAGAVAWAEAWGGSRAGLVTALVLLTNRTLVTLLGTASYVSLVGGLWLLGCWALLSAHPGLAILAGVALALVRASAWGMSVVLFLATGPLGWGAGLATGAYLVWRYPEVVQANGWVKWVRREPCTLPMNPSWAYALSVITDRYATVGVWGCAAALWGAWPPVSMLLVALTGLAFLGGHTPRLWHSPKWAVGYWPEHVPAVAVALGLVLA